MESTYLLGLAWIAGMLCRSLPAGSTWGWIWPLLVGILGAALSLRRPALLRTWLIAGLVGLVAWAYLGLRTPVPGPLDISLQAPQPRATLAGKVLTDPQETRSGRVRFWLQTTQFFPEQGQPQKAEGKLYVTMASDVLEDKDVHPGQTLEILGSLYVPSPCQNPGGFDFKSYLQQQGAFAGLSAYEVKVIDEGLSWGGWSFRRRIRSSLVQGLGPTQGELLVSMVLGSRAADLDFELGDQFRAVGMAHVLAASGFQVSLLLGVTLTLLQNALPWQKQLVGLGSLGLFLLLAGFSPPVLRAALMGLAFVVGMGESPAQKKLKLDPLGLLLLAAVFMLVIDPTQVTNLSFQLSFLATLGLMVGVNPLVARMPWIPQGIAEPAAITLSAQLWTLPLQLSVFGKLANYFLVANLLTLFFVVIISVVGFAVCGIALISPPLGALLARPLTVLIVPMMNLVGWIASWPGATFNTGTLSTLQSVLLYAPLVALTFWPAWRSRIRWQGTALIMAAIFWLPNLVWRGPAVKITVLATGRAPVMVVQSHQESVVINSGADEVVSYDLLPFLRGEGIRRIDHAIATTAEGLINGGWTQLLEEISIRNFWDGGGARVSGPYTQVLATVQASHAIQYQSLQPGDRIPTSSLLDLQVLHTAPLVLSLTTQPQSAESATWLLLGTADRNVQTSVLQNAAIRPAQANWIWWDASALSRELLEGLQIQGGVASQTGATPPEPWFQEQGRPLLNTGQDGAVCWHPGIDIYPCGACS